MMARTFDIRSDEEKRKAAVLLLAVLVSVSLPTCGEKGGDLESLVASRFLEQLPKMEYPEARPPDAPPILRWDFSGKQLHQYAFEQRVKAQTRAALALKDASDIEQSISAKGKLLVKSQGNRKADLVLQDVTAHMTMSTDALDKPKTTTQTLRPIVVQGMQEDGSSKVGDSSQETLLKLLFPLPSKPLKVGESVDVPAQMPFNAMGSLLHVEGRSRITLTRYVRIGRRTCARLDTDIDISKVDVPSELKGDYACSAKGASVFYFDLEGRCFISGTVAVLMRVEFDAPIPQVKGPAKAMPKMPKRMQMSMVSDNLIRITPLK